MRSVSCARLVAMRLSTWKEAKLQDAICLRNGLSSNTKIVETQDVFKRRQPSVVRIKIYLYNWWFDWLMEMWEDQSIHQDSGPWSNRNFSFSEMYLEQSSYLAMTETDCCSRRKDGRFYQIWRPTSIWSPFLVSSYPGSHFSAIESCWFEFKRMWPARRHHVQRLGLAKANKSSSSLYLSANLSAPSCLP